MTQGYRLQFVTRPILSRVLTISSMSSHFLRTSIVRRNQNPFGERSRTGIKVGWSRGSAPALFRAKEKWHFSTHLGPQKSEQVFKTSTIQEINYSKIYSNIGCTSGGLVCMHRPERCFFQISIWEGHRRFLRSAFSGRVFQFYLLTIGLSLAPRTFTRCMDAALAPLRHQGVRILNYLDDWLVCAQSEEIHWTKL